MATNITDLAFVDGGNNIVIRMVPNSGTGTYEFSGITDIDFSNPAGVLFIYPNDVNSTARVFIPYAWIQQIYQVV